MPISRSIPELSPRERQLLEFAAEGLTDMAIAQRLAISEATVGTYWGRVRIKLGPHSRTELVAIMMKAERDAAIAALREENEQLVRELQSRLTSGSESFYRELIQNAPDAMLLVSADGLIRYGNIAAAELFGYSDEELQGLEILALIPERYQERHRKHREDYVADPQRKQMGAHLNTPAIRKDGKEFPIRAALSAMSSPSGTVVMCVIRPVDEHR